MRDQLSGGIAMYDEDPEMYQFATRRFFAEFVPARNFWYQGNGHHQGSSYGPYRFQWEIMASWIFKRMAGADVFSPDQSQVPYAWIYAQRPDGIIMPDGDCAPVLKRNTQPPFPNFSMLLTANYYHDEVLNGIVRHQNEARERLPEGVKPGLAPASPIFIIRGKDLVTGVIATKFLEERAADINANTQSTRTLPSGDRNVSAPWTERPALNTISTAKMTIVLDPFARFFINFSLSTWPNTPWRALPVSIGVNRS